MEQTIYLPNGQFDIPVTVTCCDSEKVRQVVLGVHGFGGSKNDAIQQAIAEEMTMFCDATVRFDFPAHGDSSAPDSALTVENCMSDFAAVLSYVRNKYEGREVRFFATSFGGYILLNSLHLINECEKIVLRAPAVKMAETYRDVIAKASEAEIFEREYVICGFERKINVTSEFYRSLLRHDAMTSDDRGMLVIHGGEDSVVFPADIDEFCALHPSSRLVRMKDADHRFKGKGQVDELISYAAKWFGIDTIVKKN